MRAEVVPSTARLGRLVVLGLVLLFASASCDRAEPTTNPAAPSGTLDPSRSASSTRVESSVAPPLAPSTRASAALAAPAPSGAAPAVRAEGCPEGMVLVEGSYCPEVEQTCLEHHPEYVRDRERAAKAKAKGAKYKSDVAERCLRYAEPSRCLSKERRPMRFCVDRYEYPNQAGETPALLISWLDARKTCEGLGKRLCTEDEFNFACEGEAMLPFTYGFVRDAEKCNIDRPYRKRTRKLYRYEKCMKRPACAAHLAELDQRMPAGAMSACVSPFGVHDLNGNINEWVELPGKEYPDRSGLKGGWWGPVRGRCRPTVDFHKEEDYGYEEGFRCCADARP